MIEIYKKVKFEYKFALLYLIVSIIWIIFSDRLANSVFSNSGQDVLNIVHSTKGLFFVFMTTLIFYILIKNHLKKVKYDEIRYLNVIENIHESLVIENVEGKLIYANKEFSKMFGYSKDEFPKLSLKDYTAPECLNEIIDRHDMRMRGEKVATEFEYIGIKKDGSRLWIEARVSTLVEDGKIIGSQSLEKNITDRRQSEIALRNSELRFRTLFDKAFDGILILDEFGKIVNLNESFAKMHGYTIEEINKIELRNLDTPENVNLIKDRIRRMQSGENLHFEVDHYHKDGSIVTFDVTSNFIELNGEAYIIAIHRDLSKMKKAEAELRESHEFNQSLLQSIPLGMQIVNEVGDILFFSESFRSVMSEESIGKKCWEIYRDDKKQCEECPLLNGIHVGETVTNEISGVLGGKTFQISHTGMNYKGQKAILEIFLDITEQKQIENQLIIAKEKAEENDKLKTSFLQNMSHEIRTPLNGIIGFSKFLVEEDNTPEEIKEFTQIIEQSSIRLLDLVNNVLDVAKIETGQIEVEYNPLSINALISDLYNFFNPQAIAKNLKLICHLACESETSILYSDESKLHQIFTNLIFNAIKFTNSGQIDFGYSIKDNFVQFYVKDTGIGISEDFHKKLFDRFSQADSSISRGYEGAGLGLTISKGLVEKLGGKIWVESKIEKGSTFYFTIPYISSSN